MNLLVLHLVWYFGISDLVHCFKMKMIPGVPAVLSFDRNYIEDIIVKTRRNGRRSDYRFNTEFTSKHTWTNNNVSIHFIFYEYLHNEYRPSFVEMHFKLCDFILKDFFFGSVVRKTGLTYCPMTAGRYHLMNMTFNDEFPSVWPFEKGKGELIVKLEPGGKEIVRGSLVLNFKMI